MSEPYPIESAGRQPAWPSRLRLLAGIRRLRATDLVIINQVLRSPPIALSDGRIFVWQDAGRIAPATELIGRWGNASIALGADGLALVEPRLEGFESFVPTETCAALVEHALHPVIGMLERGAGVPIEFGELHSGRHPSLLDEPVEVSFVVYGRDMKPALRGYLRAPADCWRSLEVNRLPTLRSRRHLAVPVRLSVQLGAQRLGARALAALAPGDAVRVGKRNPGGTLSVVLADCRGQSLVHATLAEHTLTLEETVTPSTEFDPAAGATAAPAAASESGDDLLNEIECDVSFELGSIRMPVAEVARLRAGQSIRLGVRLQDQPVRLMVNGRPVGRGELATLGDELVVVLTDTSRLPHV